MHLRFNQKPDPDLKLFCLSFAGTYFAEKLLNKFVHGNKELNSMDFNTAEYILWF
jgi:hypothetical protein